MVSRRVYSRYLHYRRLLLPLSDTGEVPAMLFGVQKAIGIDGYLVGAPRVPKWMRACAVECSTSSVI